MEFTYYGHSCFSVAIIGDNFTMDAADALECARMINCKTVIGVHYDTFGYIIIATRRLRIFPGKAGWN